MSDFFNNLIARSYDLIPVARPRLASRFEPTPDASPLERSRIFALESEAFGETSEEVNPKARRAERELDSEQESKSSQAEETQPPPATTETQRVFVRQEKIERRPSQDELISDVASPLPSSGDDDDAARPSTLSSARRPAQSDVQSSFENEELHDLPAAQAASASFSARRDDEAAAIEQHAESASDTGVLRQSGLQGQTEQSIRASFESGETQPPDEISAGKQSGNERERRSIAPAKVSAQSDTKQNAETPAAAALSASETSDGASPVIRVTIGRIDVRAVMPDARAERRSAASSAPARQMHAPLSLEDYLEQRNGGRR